VTSHIQNASYTANDYATEGGRKNIEERVLSGQLCSFQDIEKKLIPVAYVNRMELPQWPNWPRQRPSVSLFVGATASDKEVLTDFHVLQVRGWTRRISKSKAIKNVILNGYQLGCSVHIITNVTQMQKNMKDPAVRNNVDFVFLFRQDTEDDDDMEYLYDEYFGWAFQSMAQFWKAYRSATANQGCLVLDQSTKATYVLRARGTSKL